MSNGGPHMAAALSHASHPSLHQQHLHRPKTGGGGGGSTMGLRQQEQHHMHAMHPHQMETTPSPAHLSTPPGMVDPSIGGSMDHHISADSMITTANTASPPNHIRNMLLNQHHQQSGGKSGGVIAGANPIMMGHHSPGPPPHHGGIHTPPLGGGGGCGMDMHSQVGLPSRGLNSSDHSTSHNSSNSSSSTGMLHSQPPISPATPPAENTPTVHNYGGWPYQPQQRTLLIGSNESYGLPILQSTTPTTQQNHTFFKASF